MPRAARRLRCAREGRPCCASPAPGLAHSLSCPPTRLRLALETGDHLLEQRNDVVSVGTIADEVAPAVLGAIAEWKDKEHKTDFAVRALCPAVEFLIEEAGEG